MFYMDSPAFCVPFLTFSARCLSSAETKLQVRKKKVNTIKYSVDSTFETFCRQCLESYSSRSWYSWFQSKKWETESLLLQNQNSTMRTNHIKAGIDNRLENNKYKLCRDRDERVNNISKCTKQAQKEYMTRPDCVGKAIHWELRKRFKS